MRYYSPYQFALFRIMLGIYLIIHFFTLIPYGNEIWSNEGVLPSANLNLTYGLFPDILYLLDSPTHVTLFLLVLLIGSILFTLGIFRQVISIVLWYGWVCLFNRNNLISNPGLPFIGWILLVCAFIPKGDSMSFSKTKSENWQMPKILFVGAWVIMSIGYTISGLDKLKSPGWSSGEAIRFLLENPLARNWILRDWMLLLPNSLIHLLTWIVLAAEVIFLPLALFSKTRPIAWFGMVLMHFGILSIVDFADLTCGMLMIHFFTFDASWFKSKDLTMNNSIVYFDGVCGLCNRTVDFLLKIDVDNKLLFAPLQGATAQKKIHMLPGQNFNTIIFQHNDKLYYRSNAIITILKTVGGFWKITLLLKIIPLFIRDYFYKLIAGNRYKWFGKKESCRMPTPAERARFL